MTKLVNLYEAKTHLSSLVDQAVGGADIVIAKNGKAKVRLVPTEAATGKKRVGGQWAKYVKNDTRTPEEWWRDWKAADAEIEQMFEESINRDWDLSTWPATSSTRMRSSGSKPARPSSRRKRSRPSNRGKTKST